MQSRNAFMDDISRVMQGAAGVAQAANDEAKTLFRSIAERIVADADLAKREEVEALKTLARTALERAEALEKRVASSLAWPNATCRAAASEGRLATSTIEFMNCAAADPMPLSPGGKIFSSWASRSIQVKSI